MTKIKSVLKRIYIYIYSLSIMFPVFALPLTLATTSTSTLLLSAQNVTINQNLTNSTSTEEKLEIKPVDVRAVKIDAYFARHNLPLTGHGKIFVEVADKYGLDYELLPAIAMRESTGGKFACPNDIHNVFGWGSCKFTFQDYESAIDKVGQHLSGNVKSTKSYYFGKTNYEKLRKYNSVISPYPKQVLAIMDKIDSMNVYTDLSLAR